MGQDWNKIGAVINQNCIRDGTGLGWDLGWIGPRLGQDWARIGSGLGQDVARIEPGLRQDWGSNVMVWNILELAGSD